MSSRRADPGDGAPPVTTVPGGWRPTGHLAPFRRDPLGFLEDVARRHGPYARLRFGRTTAYLLDDPDLIHQVLVTRRESFVKAKALRDQGRLLGNGLLLNEGDSWMDRRRLAQPAFHRDRIAAYAETMVDETARFLADLEGRDEVEIEPRLKRLTMTIASKTLFGSDVGSRAEEIGEAIEAAMDRYARRRGVARLLPAWGGGRRYRRGVRRVDRLVGELVRERRAASGAASDGSTDLLSMLMEARDERGEGLSERELRDEAVTLFVGGFDTPSLALAWAWYLLARHPDAAAALAREADDVLGSRRPVADDLPELRYADAVVKETLRLYPPAWILSRQAVRTVAIGDHELARGAVVMMSQWVRHRSARVFAEPDRFDPERWLDGALEARLHRFDYFPFGGGPRFCIGASFARMELVLALALIARRVRFVLAPGAEGTPWPTMTLRPRGLRVHVESRRLSTDPAP